jgi:hypothetical protein
MLKEGTEDSAGVARRRRPALTPCRRPLDAGPYGPAPWPDERDDRRPLFVLRERLLEREQRFQEQRQEQVRALPGRRLRP